ncbi:hypothetical protein [Nocardia elegans]|uniref:Uncharacterized protein n=1 Tax=Nocardia elegans TaxID=300029 RepID=A0ABW6THV3_9NOCA|nr:hypothetical protein [Nocardia elegans]
MRACAEAWSGDLDILINHAGVMDIPATRTRDGPGGPGGLRGYPAVGRQGKAGLDEELAGRLWNANAELLAAVDR